jgi:hypothetical protein
MYDSLYKVHSKPPVIAGTARVCVNRAVATNEREIKLNLLKYSTNILTYVIAIQSEDRGPV